MPPRTARRPLSRVVGRNAVTVDGTEGAEQRRLCRQARRAPRGNINGVQRALLGSDQEGAAVAAAEGVGDDVVGEPGVVGLLGEVGEDEGAEAVVVELADELGGGAGWRGGRGCRRCAPSPTRDRGSRAGGSRRGSSRLWLSNRPIRQCRPSLRGSRCADRTSEGRPRTSRGRRRRARR